MTRYWFVLALLVYQPATAVRQAPPPGWVTDGKIVRFKDGDTAVA